MLGPRCERDSKVKNEKKVDVFLPPAHNPNKDSVANMYRKIQNPPVHVRVRKFILNVVSFLLGFGFEDKK